MTQAARKLIFEKSLSLDKRKERELRLSQEWNERHIFDYEGLDPKQQTLTEFDTNQRKYSGIQPLTWGKLVQHLSFRTYELVVQLFFSVTRIGGDSVASN